MTASDRTLATVWGNEVSIKGRTGVRTYLCLIYAKPNFVEYWKILGTGTSFSGKNLKEILSVICMDIVTIWGIDDPHNVGHIPCYAAFAYHFRYSKCLCSDGFQALVFQISGEWALIRCQCCISI